MSRILSDEEISEAAQKADKWAIVNKQFIMEISRNVAKAQDTKTYKATLKKVGEWLEKALYFEGYQVIGGVTEEQIQSLLKGELPV